MTLEDLEDLNDLQMYSESVSATVCSPRAIPLQVLLFSFYARLKKEYYTAPTAAWLGLQNRPHHMLALQEPSPLCQRPANALPMPAYTRTDVRALITCTTRPWTTCEVSFQQHHRLCFYQFGPIVAQSGFWRKAL
jgi:hypothetical protein